jgi:nucleotide-binding universal stress UspA family protein
MFKKILVPLDGSKLAEQVFPSVVQLAKPLDSEIIVLGVCEANAKVEGEICRVYLEEQSRVLNGRLSGYSANSKTEVLFGKPSEQILRYAIDEKIDVIFMTSHGRSGLMPWSLGSTVDKVFKRTSVPIIVVRAKEKPDKTSIFSCIAVPLDGSERSTAVLPYVKELAEILPSEVFLFKVIEEGRHVRTIGGLDHVRFLEQDINLTKESAKKDLENLRENMKLIKSKVHCEVRTGDAASEIVKYTDIIDCTLIAMTSHGHHGIEAWALGSVASKVVSVAEQSVMLVPSFTRK